MAKRHRPENLCLYDVNLLIKFLKYNSKNGGEKMVTIEKLAEEILNDLHNDLIDESIGTAKMRTCSKCHRQFDARLEYGESYYELAEMAMEYGTWYHNGCM